MKNSTDTSWISNPIFAYRLTILSLLFPLSLNTHTYTHKNSYDFPSLPFYITCSLFTLTSLEISLCFFYLATLVCSPKQFTRSFLHYSMSMCACTCTQKSSYSTTNSVLFCYNLSLL